MSKLTNEEFMDFLESYNSYLMPLSEMTKNHLGDSLIESSFKFYSLDDIVFNMGYDIRMNPKTTDTIYFKNENGKLVLYLMEFKFMNFIDTKNQAKKLFEEFKKEYTNTHNFSDELYDYFMNIIEFEFEFADIEDSEVIARRLFDQFKVEYAKNQTFNETYLNYFEKIFYSYEDGNLVNIIFKVIETLNIFIPELYEKYCHDNNIQVKDIREYIRNIDKRFILVIDNNKQNPIRSRMQTKNIYLTMQLEKLVIAKIIDDFNIYDKSQFDLFLKSENIII